MGLVERALGAGRSLVAAATQGAERVARAARPPRTHVQPLAPMVTSRWTIAEAMLALDEHERGYFARSAQLATAFGRDDRIAACRNTRTRALAARGTSFELKPAVGGDQRRAAFYAQQVKAFWWSCVPEPVLARILADGIDLGVSISRIHWTLVGGSWTPHLEPWDMQLAHWSALDGCYVVATANGPMRVEVGTGEWFVYEPAGACGWMAGGVRALALAFLFRAFTFRDWARFCEKHGVPVLAITEPDADDDASFDTKKRFYDRLRRLGREGILRLPQDEAGRGFDAKFLEPKSTSWPAFQAFLASLNTAIAIYLLGQNLTTEVNTGSMAAATTQNLVRLDYLSSDAESLATAFRAQLLMPWGRFNFDGFVDALAPWPYWHTQPPEDARARAQTFDLVMTALGRAKACSAPVDVRAVLDQFGIPMLPTEPS